MPHDNSSFDSLIFDMDGTLWDAVDTYARVWNMVLTRFGVDRAPVTRHELVGFMGKPLDVITKGILGDAVTDMPAFLAYLDSCENELLPRQGGLLYPGVERIIPMLARRFRLFMVSNCGRTGLSNFLRFAGLTPYFTDALSQGLTGLDKCDNMLRLVADYSLRAPLYVGDTDGDATQTHAAGLPFAWAAYGFGHTDNYEIKLDSPSDLARLLNVDIN